MGRKRKISFPLPEEPKVKIDLSNYTIVNHSMPFPTKVYKEYYGNLSECILDFEKKYGKIDGTIFVTEKTSGCSIGFTGTQVNAMAKLENIT